MTCTCACHRCRCIVVTPHPKNGRPWEWEKAYFKPGDPVVVQECFGPKRPAVVVDIKPGRRYARVNYAVKYHDGTNDVVLLEDLVGWWALSNAQRITLGRGDHGAYFCLPRGHTWPFVCRKKLRIKA